MKGDGDREIASAEITRLMRTSRHADLEMHFDPPTRLQLQALGLAPIPGLLIWCLAAGAMNESSFASTRRLRSEVDESFLPAIESVSLNEVVTYSAGAFSIRRKNRVWLCSEFQSRTRPTASWRR